MYILNTDTYEYVCTFYICQCTYACVFPGIRIGTHTHITSKRKLLPISEDLIRNTYVCGINMARRTASHGARVGC